MKGVNLNEGELFYACVGEGTIAARFMVMGGVLFLDTDIKASQLGTKLASVTLNLQESNVQLRNHLDLLGGVDKGFEAGDFDSEGGNHD
jgi:hypothetical protein